MGTSLVPLALAGAAVLLLSNKGKARKSVASKGSSAFSYKPIESGSMPESYSGTRSTTWTDRQKALQLVSQIEFITRDGGSVRLCSRCDPMIVDGVPGPKTREAIQAFQAISGLPVTGEWSEQEDRAMHRILTSFSQDRPIACDPKISYPNPFFCVLGEDGYSLVPKRGPELDPGPTHPSESEYGPDDILVIDPECNYVLHQDNQWFVEQQRRAISYALEGLTDSEAAREIHESMLADYSPLCLSLGKKGVGPGVRQFWDVNVGWIGSLLKVYEAAPDRLEDDAIKFDIL